jgi:hypothetical protein
MRCDSQASLLVHTLASPYLGHEPKARVALIVVVSKCVTYKKTRMLVVLVSELATHK